MTHRYRGQEDCLTLNVFVPKNEGKAVETLPVMFYIYGGAFVMGETGIYQCEFINVNLSIYKFDYNWEYELINLFKKLKPTISWTKM